MSVNADRVRLIAEARSHVERLLNAHGIDCDAFTHESIAMKLDWCFYRGMDARTAINQVAAQYVREAA